MGEQNNFTRRMFIKGIATSFGALPVFAWPRWAQAFYYNLGFFKKGQNSAAYVEDVFSTYLYTGAASTGTLPFVNGIDLTQGGLVWLKERSNIGFGHYFFDTARGTGGKYLTSSTTAAEATDADTLTVFNNNGWTIGRAGLSNNTGINSTGATYASWSFRKAAKFFDIVTYTGDGTSNRNIAHALGVAPGMIAIKRTNSISDWYVYHRGWGFPAEGGRLNGTDAFGSTYKALESADPTITTFTPAQTNANVNGATYVAYLFAHDISTDGLIQCGSYTGSGGVDSVTLGWEPQFVLMKGTGVGTQWSIEDVMRDMNHSGQKQIQPNSNGAELSQSAYVIPNATGFTVNAGYYGTGAKVVYVAIRRPMKTPTDATKVFSIVNSGPLVDGLFGMTTSFAADFWLWKDKTTTAGWYLSDRLRGTPFFNTASNSAESVLGTAWDSNTNIRLTGNSTVPTNFIQYAFRRAPGFFDQICYTGDGTGPKLYNHNLKVLPDLVILKSRSTGNWCVGVRGLTGGLNNNVALNLTNAVGTNFGTESSAFSIQDTTTTGFNVYAGLNASATNYTAYLFASCPGVSKVGSYTGNGSSQTINCGFTNGARFILIKRTDVAGDWYVWDTARGISTTPPATGETVFSTPGTYSWTVPVGITSVSALAIGAGASGSGNHPNAGNTLSGGGGGALAYANNISVTPGATITVVVGAGGQYDIVGGNSGGSSSFGTYCNAGGGKGGTNGLAGGTVAIGTGGNGGAGGSMGSTSGGGGGTGGYSGNGGNGGIDNGNGSNGSGGAGGGGSTGIGGGVGIYGVGASGAGGINPGSNGGPGSNGSGNQYGAGGGGGGNYGAHGVVRIMWGAGKSFPSAAGSSTVYNANDPHLSLNSTAAEVASDNSIDTATSGFIVNQDTATNINVTAATYIFMAIA